MTEPLYSQSWYRVAGLKPSLRGHARIHRHDYRGQVWYVLEDGLSGRCHRFSAAAQALIGLMDGRRTVQEIWDSAAARLGEEAPSQDETIRLLGQMHAADVLACDLPPDSGEIALRRQRQDRKRLLQRLAQPLSIRIPLVDPDAWLTRWLPLVRPLLSWAGLALWLAATLAGAALAASHWSELTLNLADRVLSAESLLGLWLAYPLVKGLHELGHGFATKRWGGEVHEIGIMLLVLMPVPYVEASAASAFQDKYQRALVGAMGVMVELLLAALAMILWVDMEPGLARTLAFDVMLIGGVSSLFFNGNPLLRFDGYYVLADLIEIPNLATRSQQYLSYLAQRHLFGLREAESPRLVRGERTWLLGYGVASFLYRMLVLFAIALFIAGQFFVVGVLLAIWAVLLQAVWPLAKGLRFVLASPLLDRRRARATLVTLGLGGAALAFALLVPVPSWTRAQGVVWLPELAQVRAAQDGLVTALARPDGALVAPGDPLVETDDPFLGQQVRLLEARLAELRARLTEAQAGERSRAPLVREEIAVVDADLARARERQAALVVTSPAAGRLVVPQAADLPGRFVRRGEAIAYVVDPAQTSLRAVVDQERVGLVRGHTESVQVRLAQWGAPAMPARILRQVPAATDRLPAAALGSAGGGDIPLDPRDDSGLKPLEPVFVVELERPPGLPADFPGQRVEVRFDHGSEPLAVQWYRSLRQLFLARFGV
jgi:putative peptide zinc metalloprotease protein